MENMTRQELLEFIKSKEEELADLRKAVEDGEPVDIAEMSRIEDEIEEAEYLEKDLEKAEQDLNEDAFENQDIEEEQVKMMEEQKVQEQDLEENEKEVLEEELDDEDRLLKEEQGIENEEIENIIDEKEEQELDDEEQKIQDEEIENNGGEYKLSVTAWQIKTGIEIIPDEYIKQKYDKNITEEEFKDILRNENVPKVIQKPGKAEQYLKTSEDWENVKTSKSALEEAIRIGNFPVNVEQESYILLEYNKDEIRSDVNNDSKERVEIDEKDIKVALGDESVAVEEVKTDSNDNVLGEIDVYKSAGKTYVKAKDVEQYIEKQQELTQTSEEEIPEFMKEMEKDLGGVSEEEKQSVTAELMNDMLNPYIEPELSEELENEEELGEIKFN